MDTSLLERLLTMITGRHPRNIEQEIQYDRLGATPVWTDTPSGYEAEFKQMPGRRRQDEFPVRHNLSILEEIMRRQMAKRRWEMGIAEAFGGPKRPSDQWELYRKPVERNPMIMVPPGYRTSNPYDTDGLI